MVLSVAMGAWITSSKVGVLSGYDEISLKFGSRGHMSPLLGGPCEDPEFGGYDWDFV